MHCLLESVALLTMAIGILNPLIPSIVVVVAPRLISYKNQPQDCIVQRSTVRSYRTRAQARSISYMGFEVRRKEKKERGSPMYLCSM